MSKKCCSLLSCLGREGPTHLHIEYLFTQTHAAVVAAENTSPVVAWKALAKRGVCVLPWVRVRAPFWTESQCCCWFSGQGNPPSTARDTLDYKYTNSLFGEEGPGLCTASSHTCLGTGRRGCMFCCSCSCLHFPFHTWLAKSSHSSDKTTARVTQKSITELRGLLIISV